MSLFRATKFFRPLVTLQNAVKVPCIQRPLSTFKPLLKRAELSVTFITADGEKHTAKVPFIYYVSNCIFSSKLNLTMYLNFTQKLGLFVKGKIISVSTLHFDEIFFL